MTNTATLEHEEFTLIGEGAHIALLENETAKGKYYYMTHEPDVEKPWVAIDKSGPELRSGNFGTKAEVFNFLAGQVEDAGAEFDRLVGLTPQNGTTAKPTLPDSGVQERAGDVFDPVEDVTPAPEEIQTAEEPQSPYIALSDAELTEQIATARDAYYKEFLDFASAEAKITALMAQLEKENAALFARKKAAKEAKIEKAAECKDIALEYFRRNPGEKKFDVYITAKDFEEWEVDEVAAWPWVRENLAVAIVPPVKERLDYAQIIDYGKSCVKRKTPYPACLKRKLRTEVQLSTKVALPEIADPSA